GYESTYRLWWYASDEKMLLWDGEWNDSTAWDGMNMPAGTYEIYLESNQHNGQVELGGYFAHCLYSAEHYNNASIHADRFHLATVLLQADENAEELQINATSKVDFEGFEADGFTYPAIGMVKNKTASCTVAMSCDHNYQFVKVITPATCVQQGSDLYVCSVCGDEMTSVSAIDPTVHAGKTELRGDFPATCGKDGYTGDTYCLDCGVKTANGTTVPATGNHTWDNGVQTLAPTYTTPGVKTFTCTVCGGTRTEEIAQLESVFEEDEEQVVIIEEVGLVTKAGATVTEFLEKASEGTVIVNAKGEELKEDDLPGTGCVLVLPDGTEHTIVIPGDINGDGEILSSDARKALRSAVGLENLQGAYSTAADVDATGGIAVADARKILRASVHLDDPDEWFDVFKSNTAA
ncbi:MAG: dockerin type I repeat-containing protein, partial [Clostridia bacterium]|nr:dockerin type I repeat-containing protein [Clostridia bacterium]